MTRSVQQTPGYVILDGKANLRYFQLQEAEVIRLMQEKCIEMFKRLDALGVKYHVLHDSVDVVDVPLEKLEAVQNVFRELWPSDMIGERT